MVSGATSPARPWFRLSTPDSELNSNQEVKVWLDDVTKRMLRVFRKSNTYDSLHELYLELGAFGTGAMIVVQDFENVIHCYPLTAGEYAISADAKGRVCTLFREYEMTVSQIVKEFGIENCSATVQNLFTNGNGLDSWIPVIHAIEPRADRDPSKKDAKNMAWGPTTSNTVRRESSFARVDTNSSAQSARDGRRLAATSTDALRA
jgi:hypothetical protein